MGIAAASAAVAIMLKMAANFMLSIACERALGWLAGMFAFLSMHRPHCLSSATSSKIVHSHPLLTNRAGLAASSTRADRRVLIRLQQSYSIHTNENVFYSWMLVNSAIAMVDC